MSTPATTVEQACEENNELFSTPTSLPPNSSIVNEDDVVELGVDKDFKFPLDDATINDIVVEQSGSFLIQKTRGDNEPEYSALKEIKGIPVVDIKVGALRAFCVRIGLKGQGRATKQEIVHKLLEFKATPPPSSSEKAAGTKKAPVNRYRFVNVLFGDTIKPMLNERGKSLTKDDLTAGKLGDQDLFTAISNEYNGTKDEYGIIHESFKELVPSRQHPKVYEPMDWTQAKRCFRDFLWDYEKSVSNWKVSGTHEDYDDNLEKTITVIDKPFESFVNNNSSLKYLHLFMEKSPGLFEYLVGALPEGVFVTSAARDSNSETQSTNKKTPPSTASKNSRSNNELLAYNKIQAERNSIMEKRAEAAKMQCDAALRSSRIEDLKNLDEMLTKNLDTKRRLKRALEEALPDKQQRKSRKWQHDQRVKRRKQKGEDTEDDDTDESKADIMDDFNNICHSVAEMKAMVEDARRRVTGEPPDGADNVLNETKQEE